MSVPLVGQPKPKVTAAYEFLTPELQGRWEELKALMEANQRRSVAVQAKAAQYGGQIAIPDQRLQAFIDMVWPADTAEGQDMRLRHDMLCQERLRAILEQAEAGIAQAALAAGAMVTPEQMAAAAGIPAGLAQAPERRHR